MKAIQTAGLMGAMLTAVRLASAQVLTPNVGVPISTSLNPGGAFIVITEAGFEGQVLPVSSINFQFSPVFAGDLLLVNPTGGNAPANWAADIRFFNPLDPTGVLGLPATETEAFFPTDLGPGGFAAFALFPNYNLVPVLTIGGGLVTGSTLIFGPVGGILPGQTALLFFDAVSASPAAVPEPGSVALLATSALTGAGFLARRRKQARKAA